MKLEKERVRWTQGEADEQSGEVSQPALIRNDPVEDNSWALSQVISRNTHEGPPTITLKKQQQQQTLNQNKNAK